MKLAWSYRCGDPIDGLDAALAEHERCVELWDDLVNIDRQYDRDVLEAAATRMPVLQAVLDEIVTLALVIRETPKDQRTSALYEQMRSYRCEQWAQVKRWRKTHPDEARAVEQRRQTRVKAARRASLAYWPNYNGVISRFEAGRASSRKRGGRMRYHDDARDDGVLHAQIQRTRTGLGAAADELDRSPLIQLQPAPTSIDFSGSRRLRRCIVRLTVDREHRQIVLPVIIHRPLPPGCRVKGALLSWRRVASELRWTLTLQLADVATQPVPLRYHRTGQLQLRWDRLPQGDLLCAVIGHRKLTLTREWCRRMDRVAELRRRLDESLEAQREQASGPMRKILALPEHEMLAVLAARQELGEWRRGKDGWKRIWEQHHHLRDKLLAYRRELYRHWAREIVREYPDIEMDDQRLDQVARQEHCSESNRLRHIVAPHLIRSEVIHQANKIGAVVRASGKVLTARDNDESGAWQRRRHAQTERSESGTQVTDTTPDYGGTVATRAQPHGS